MAAGTESIKTTCPRDCYDACGIVVVRRPGHAPQVRGDVDHHVSQGKLCRKCTIAYNGVFLDETARLTTPLIRTGPKGSGLFREATWDEALGYVAERLGQVVSDKGGGAITYAHYTGTCSLLAYNFPCRLFRQLGATEVNPDTICNNAGHVALDYVYGTSLDGFDPRTSVDAECILVWGCNPSATAPHQQEHWLDPFPGSVIVVDPIRTDSAKAADLHLQLRPGTDAALAFAFLHVAFRDGHADRAFLADHSIGWQELETLAVECTPVWAEQETGVPAALIEEAARIYGAGRSLLWIGQGLQRQPTGGNITRTVSMLSAVTGNIGRAGSGFLYLNAERRNLDDAHIAGVDLYPDVPDAIGHMDLVGHLGDLEQVGALVCFNINLAASNPDQARLREVLTRDDLFTVVVDLFSTDTADYADVVLPAASFLEFDDIVASYFHRSLSAQVRAIDAPGQALSNMEIFRRLAAAMGLDDPALHESDSAMLARLMEGTGTGLTFAELAERGTIWPESEPSIQFADFVFNTPSGQIELVSETAAADGHGRLPHAGADAAPTDGRLRLLSPAIGWMLNTSFSNDPKIRRQAGAMAVFLHPDEARLRGLLDGATVLIASATGQLEAALVISDDVPPGVAYFPKGRWLKQEAAGANVNVLNPSRVSDMGESATYHGTEVTVVAVR